MTTRVDTGGPSKATAAAKLRELLDDEPESGILPFIVVPVSFVIVALAILSWSQFNNGVGLNRLATVGGLLAVIAAAFAMMDMWSPKYRAWPEDVLKESSGLYNAMLSQGYLPDYLRTRYTLLLDEAIESLETHGAHYEAERVALLRGLVDKLDAIKSLGNPMYRYGEGQDQAE